MSTTTRVATGPLKTAIKRWLKASGMDIDVDFYSKTAWADRGEPYGNDAVMSMTFEGPLYDALNYGVYHARDRMERICAEHGFWFEQGYAWIAVLYRLETR